MTIDRLFKEIIDRIDRLEMQTGTPRKPWPDMVKPATTPAAKKPGRPKKDEETSDE